MSISHEVADCPTRFDDLAFLKYIGEMKNSPETLKKRNEKRKRLFQEADHSKIPPFKIKVCKDCNKEGPCPFTKSFNMKGNPEYRTRCHECYKVHCRKLCKKGRKRLNESVLRRKKVRKQKCIDYLGGKCYRCGYTKSNRALTFHHRLREEKEFTLSQKLDNNWEKVKAELDKCDLVCFNCHMEIEDEFELNEKG